MMEKSKIDISVTTIVKIVLVLGLLYLLYLIRDIILLFFIVLIVVAALRPVVRSWSRRIGKIPAISALILLIVLAISGFVYLVIPPFIAQTKDLISNIPDYSIKLSYLRSHFPIIEKTIQEIPQSIGSLATNFISITAGFFSGIISFVTVIIMSIYLLMDDHGITKSVDFLVPDDKKEAVKDILRKIYDKIGFWLRGQLLLGLIMGTVTFSSFAAIKLPYALTLGIVAAVLEFIPIVGPILTGVLAGLIALSISPLMVLLVIIIVIVLNQLENSILVPNIMKKAVGLPPVIIILAVLIGGKLLGIIGAILAIPTAASVYVVVREWPTIKRIMNQ